jgi:hypothetical protein
VCALDDRALPLPRPQEKQRHAAATLSLLRGTAISLLRGDATLKTTKLLHTARAELVDGLSPVLLTALDGHCKGPAERKETWSCHCATSDVG